MGYVLGIDEAGRGAWAGPLVVGAVIMGDFVLDGLTDSKLLPKHMREKFAESIYRESVSVTLGWVNPQEIDSMGLTEATSLGINRALSTLNCDENEIIIDGNINYLKHLKNSKCIIKADMTVPEVSAAGIIAKVARDEYMRKIAIDYPGYGFETHVGYGTKKHINALRVHGITGFHRLSYKPILKLA
ncbi:MAG TPA: ribonuclease HII [Candidatus Saccharimonadales bacterium]|nr:ribonuclease HII [Candidatus Saccharimonadales bacterium]